MSLSDNTPSARITIKRGIGLRTFGITTTIWPFEYLEPGATILTDIVRSGFEASSDIKEDLDWDDDANDMNTENVFVLRRDIRRARAALTQQKRK